MRKIWYFLLPLILFATAAVLILSAFRKGRDNHETTPVREPVAEVQKRPPFLEMQDTRWADSVLAGMTINEKIGQLFMVAAYSNRDQNHVNEITNLIKNQHIGGLIFMQGGPLREARLTNQYQKAAKVPLMISIDGEWGLSMRLDSTVKFPRQMTLGALRDDSLIYEMGKEIALQCRRMGIHVNFAPVVDVNNNPLNPVISTRSFGENKELVARKGIMYMNGMQDQRILANAKHFPGHGDTDSDSHYTLPLISHTAARIDTVELYPFRRLIFNGLGSMMIAHLNIPALDSTKNTASTLSPLIVDSLLKKRMGFEGLIFTDALNMKGVANYFNPGELELKAFLAGNDVLLFPENVPVAAARLKKAIDDGVITEAELDSRVRKLLLAKQWVGLDNYQPVITERLFQDLNNKNSDLLIRRITEKSITVLMNKDSIIPLRNLEQRKVATVGIGQNANSVFQETISLYGPADHFNLPANATRVRQDTLLGKLKEYNTIIIQISGTNQRPNQKFGLHSYTSAFIDSVIASGAKVIVNITSNAYILGFLPNVHNADAVVLGYEDNAYSQSYTAQAIYGGIGVTGRLPVTVNLAFKAGDGVDTKSIRFKYSIPEDAGMDSEVLSRIDNIVMEGIREKAYPGAQVLVAKSGAIVYHKAFGHHTYENKVPVTLTDIYDIASITKIAGSVPVLMDLSTRGELDLDKALGDYLPEARGTNKQNLKLREILAHQAGLKSWIPFYLSTISKGEYKPDIFRTTLSLEYPMQVAKNLFIHHSWKDTILKKILDSPLGKQGEYLYSDLGYYLLQQVAERVHGESLDKIAREHFYSKLGMTTTTYNPLDYFPSSRIIPTEYDMAFRKQLVHGYVHDQGAAMLGGVAGHAGLFSNANDLAKLMQMYLQNGFYGGDRFIPEEVVMDFTRQQFCENENRRGAGFNQPDPNSGGPICIAASMLSFGHSGFTGTLAWADPEKEIVYIFLSNRVYPDAENRKLVKMDIRTRIHDLIYKADTKPVAYNPFR